MAMADLGKANFRRRRGTIDTTITVYVKRFLTRESWTQNICGIVDTLTGATKGTAMAMVDFSKRKLLTKEADHTKVDQSCVVWCRTAAIRAMRRAATAKAVVCDRKTSTNESFGHVRRSTTARTLAR
jgi:hypothetical protein